MPQFVAHALSEISDAFLYAIKEPSRLALLRVLASWHSPCGLAAQDSASVAHPNDMLAPLLSVHVLQAIDTFVRSVPRVR